MTKEEKMIDSAKLFAQEFFEMKKEENEAKLEYLDNLKYRASWLEHTYGAEKGQFRDLKISSKKEQLVLLEALDEAIEKIKTRIKVCEYNLNQSEVEEIEI